MEAYYIIDKDSVDYSKIKNLGNAIQKNSINHYLLFIAAKYKISTHIFGYAPNSMLYASFPNLLNIKGKKIFLQHGVIKDDLPQLYKEKTKLDLFICGAKPEYDFIKEFFHYTNEVKYTGLARYDNLHEFETKKQILIMPTWRAYLSNREEVKTSNYVTSWNSLLNNERLIRKLEKNNIELIFYPHYEMQKYVDLFYSKNRFVKIADFNNYDVQTLLKESKLLITDYSSVYFDFAYMKKPILYYQFDIQEFTSKHYSKGYFDYDSMGFGEKVERESELVNLIEKYIENGFVLQDKYKLRDEKFFALHDKKNCERIFQEIEKL